MVDTRVSRLMGHQAYPEGQALGWLGLWGGLRVALAERGVVPTPSPAAAVMLCGMMTAVGVSPTPAPLYP